MTTSSPLQQNPYVQNILEQPAALEDTLARLRSAPALGSLPGDITSGKIRQVVLTGMGSSCHAFYPLYYSLLQAGLAVVLMETSELIYYADALLKPGALLIAASQSGKSAEIVRLLEMNQGRAAVVGITNTPGSPLAEQASPVVMMRAGAEATVSSKTYLAMEMIMPWLAGVLLGKPVEPTLRDLALAPQLVAAYLQGWEQHVAWFAGALTGARCLYYAGRGPSLAAANTAGLITKESAHFPAEGLSSAAFRHGPIEMAQPGTSVVIFAGEPATRPLNLRLAGDIRRAGGSALLVSEDSPEDALRLPTAPAILRPILEILPVQMITLALAQLAGHSPGSFRHATKVTSEE